MTLRTIELYHPQVNNGDVVSIVVEMTRIYCSPPNHAGLREMDDIDITVPIRSEEHRVLHEFENAISGSSGIVPIRLATGDHVGMWSVRRRQFMGDSVLYTMCFSGTVERYAR